MLARQAQLGLVKRSPCTTCIVPAAITTRLLVTTRATQDNKSWAEIGAEVAGVVK